MAVYWRTGEVAQGEIRDIYRVVHSADVAPEATIQLLLEACARRRWQTQSSAVLDQTTGFFSCC